MKCIPLVMCWGSMLCLSLFSTTCVAASDNGWQIYLNNLQQQEQVLVAQQAIEEHRFTALNQLHQRGHASWLEQREQRLKLEESKACVRAFQGYAADVKKLQQEFPSLAEAQFYFGNLKFTDVHVASADHAIEADLTRLRKQQAETQQESNRLEKATLGLPSNDPWKQQYFLRWDLENKKAKWLASQIKLHEFQIESTPKTDRPADESRFVAREPSSDLKDAASNQIAIQQRLIQHLLQFENQRIAVLREMENRGTGNRADTDIVATHLEELQLREEEQEFVATLFAKPSEKSNYVKSSSTLSVVSNNDVSRQLQESFARGESSYQYQVASLRKQMLSEVLGRMLKISQPIQTEPDYSGLSKSISEANQQEIANYRWRIQLMDLEMKLAKARQNTLTSAKGTFVVLDDNWRDSRQETVRQPAGNLPLIGLLGRPLLNHLLVADAAALSDARTIDLRPLTIGLNKFPVGSFSSNDRLFRPVKLSSTFQSYRPKYRNRRGRSSSASSSLKLDSFRRYTNSSRYRSNFDYSNRYSRSHLSYQGRQFARAYPFGSLDSSLHRFTTPGQPPWLLPGSPTNLRKQQLRTNFGRDSFGRTGNQLLKTRNYTDIYGR